MKYLKTNDSVCLNGDRKL